MSIECMIVHNIPGRARFRVKHKTVVRNFAQELQSFVLTRPGATSARVNAHCGSIVVESSPSSITPQSLADELTAFLAACLAETNGVRLDEKCKVGVGGEGRIQGGDHAGGWPLTAASPQHGALSDPGGCSLIPRESGPATQRPTTPRWHKLDVDQVIEGFGSDPANGLSLAEASDRLFSYGPNSLGKIDGRSTWSTLANQFATLPVALLVGSAAVSVVTGGLADAVVILGVVAVNACIGFVTERQAEQTIASLQDDADMPATVIRDGRRQPVAGELVVPGDIVVLTPGTTVAADVRLIETERLMMDESTLTGESMPVPKSPSQLGGERIALRDRRNMLYRGTTVTGGSGLGIAVGTGLNTEVGAIQSLVGAATAPETPVQRQLGELGTKLGLLTGVICGGVFGVGLLRRYGMVEMLKTATSLAVAAVPEGLPMVATTTLALGVNRMRRLNVAVRRLDAVETLGSVQVFCLDKTGTLTRNEMRVVHLYVGNHAFEVNGDGVLRGENARVIERDELRRLLEVAVLCNETDVRDQIESRDLDGSPTESALVHMALDSGIDVLGLRRAYPVLRTEYRTERRGFMTTMHETRDGRRLLAVKGRPSDVLQLCRRQLVEGDSVELTAHDRAAIKTENELMAGKGLRVLGFAFREESAVNGSDDAGLTWLGLGGIADPVRSGMHDLMQTFHNAGICTKMITGDQSATAHSIGRELGLSGKPEIRTIDATELETIDPDVLKSLAENVDVFSSASPSHKLQIVQALQRAGKVVAMTGDGINDGPALKAADIGVAMGGEGATDVARMTADVVLEDDNLQSMVTAIGQGRAIYSNTRNAVRYLLATNMSEIIVMFSSVAAGTGTPLNPMQLLWINLVSDIFPVLALAVQPPEEDVLQRAPRDANEPFLDREDLQRLLVQSSVISAGTFGSYAWGRYRYGTNAHGSTMAFMSITAAQLLHMLNSRSDRHSIFSPERPPSNRYLKSALFGGFALQLVTEFIPPLRRLLRNSPLSVVDLTISLLGAGLPFVVNEAIKEAQAVRKIEHSPTCESTPISEGTSP